MLGHRLPPGVRRAGISLRAVEQERVLTDRAHAALVLAEYGVAQGWCQYGSAEELSNIKHRRVYGKGAPPLPDRRITCFYVRRPRAGHHAGGAGRRSGSPARPKKPWTSTSP
ncbi:hypothetical protein [Streptosporangium minutum]|uniref:hypothetical protein n=1 Tax=Streptosporangium minutum TaxID=569862 RepID=UPI001A990557|nr:hypothetical protein [Streptosporangium minutum]